MTVPVGLELGESEGEPAGGRGVAAEAEVGEAGVAEDDEVGGGGLSGGAEVVQGIEALEGEAAMEDGEADGDGQPSCVTEGQAEGCTPHDNVSLGAGGEAGGSGSPGDPTEVLVEPAAVGEESEHSVGAADGDTGQAMEKVDSDDRHAVDVIGEVVEEPEEELSKHTLGDGGGHGLSVPDPANDFDGRTEKGLGFGDSTEAEAGDRVEREGGTLGGSGGCGDELEEVVDVLVREATVVVGEEAGGGRP